MSFITMARSALACALLATPALANTSPHAPPPHTHARLFVLTDIEADPDDSQSLVRLLLYANDMDIEGIAATTSSSQQDHVAPDAIHRIIDAYGQARGNLVRHDAHYPTAHRLHAMVSAGPASYGMRAVGTGKTSPAARALLAALEKPDPRPLWVAIWGGPNVLAQTLWEIRATKGTAEAERLYARLRVHAILDQDDSGPWIRRTFPSVWYLVSPGPANATWKAMSAPHPGADQQVVSPEWLARNIQQGHGPLGAAYPDISYSMEGDTPSFLGLIDNGLNVPERPDWGGWGGRYELSIPPLAPPAKGAAAQVDFRIPESRPIWTNATDAYPPPRAGRRPAIVADRVEDNYVTLWRWRNDVQADFAGRMAWATAPSYRLANHAPVALIHGPDRITVRSGEIFSLDARGSYDPDGDSLSYLWFQYPEGGSYRDTVSFGDLAPNLVNIHSITAPQVSSSQTVMFVVRVSDKASLPMVSYRRVIVTVVPE